MSFHRLMDISKDLIDSAAQYPFVRRTLFNQLSPAKQTVIILKGARGIGKSTLIQQFLFEQYSQGKKVFYLSADSTLLNQSLSELAYEYQKRGGEFLAIDEIHKYSNWDAEIKTILDSFPNLKLLVTGSSSIKLDYTASDLSRRHIMVHAKGLSFREYLEKTYQIKFKQCSLQELIRDAEMMVSQITRSMRERSLDLLELFHQYLRNGYFPTLDNFQTNTLYYHSLINSINSIIDGDLPYTHPELDVTSKQKIKGLLTHIAAKCPFTPNISELSRSISIANDNTLKKYLLYLNESEILTNLYPQNKSHKDFQRPQKIFLDNPNYAYAYDQDANIGTIRETFVANCLQTQGHITAPNSGDFCLDDHWVFEVVGRSKNKRQIKSIQNAYVFADDILTTEYDHLPLWLLGFLW